MASELADDLARIVAQDVVLTEQLPHCLADERLARALPSPDCQRGPWLGGWLLEDLRKPPHPPPEQFFIAPGDVLPDVVEEQRAIAVRGGDSKAPPQIVSAR